MPPDVVSRVFEPFFTTKAAGAGSGLGLSMVYGFARQSGGTVHIASEIGRGTTVTMYLPLTRKPSATGVPVAANVAPSTLPRRVLIVEDEAPVRSTVRRQLETLGHGVLEAESAAAALALLKSDQPPNVLLTDVQLGGGMNGVDLAEAARVFHPELPVIFMSGFTAVPEAQKRITASGAALLGKPVTLSELDRALNEVTSGNPQDISRS
jgi:CheY-like chemotaxis protein